MHLYVRIVALLSQQSLGQTAVMIFRWRIYNCFYISFCSIDGDVVFLCCINVLIVSRFGQKRVNGASQSNRAAAFCWTTEAAETWFKHQMFPSARLITVCSREHITTDLRPDLQLCYTKASLSSTACWGRRGSDELRRLRSNCSVCYLQRTEDEHEWWRRREVSSLSLFLSQHKLTLIGSLSKIFTSADWMFTEQINNQTISSFSLPKIWKWKSLNQPDEWRDEQGKIII